MPDPDRPPQTPGPAAGEPASTSPASTFRDRWAQTVTSTQTPRRWAVIAAAIATADAARTDEFGDPVARGGEVWCRVAVTALESPASATAAHLPDRLPQRCFTDPDLARAWLTAPAPYAHHGATIADGLDLTDWDRASDEARHRAMDNLLTQAQDAGVFGVHGFRAQPHRVVDSDDAHAGYLLIARPEFGPGLASPPLADDDLIPTGTRSPLEGAVRILASAATIVDATLDAHDAAQHSRTEQPDHRRRGAAFRTAGHTDPASDAATPTLDPPTSTPSRPRRR